MGASIGLIVDALPDTEATESVPIAISQVILAIWTLAQRKFPYCIMLQEGICLLLGLRVSSWPGC